MLCVMIKVVSCSCLWISRYQAWSSILVISSKALKALNLSDRIYILKNRPGQIVSEIKLDWSGDEDKEVQKIAYKRQILAELGLDK